MAKVNPMFGEEGGDYESDSIGKEEGQRERPASEASTPQRQRKCRFSSWLIWSIPVVLVVIGTCIGVIVWKVTSTSATMSQTNETTTASMTSTCTDVNVAETTSSTTSTTSTPDTLPTSTMSAPDTLPASSTSTLGTPPTRSSSIPGTTTAIMTTTDDSISSTAQRTTPMATTISPTMAEPIPDVGWVLGESVSRINSTEDNGTTTFVDSGWKVNSTMNEEISNVSSYTGHQCWHYKKGWNSGQSGGGTPFSPALNLRVGRSDGSYTGDVDSFYASFWFKMAKDYTDRWGDGTRIMVVAGDPNGTTGSSNYLEIYFRYRRRAEISVRTKESYPSYEQCAIDKDCGDDFGFTYSYIADDLDPTIWHHVEMTLRSQPQDYADQWSYLIDSTYSHQGGAFYKTEQYDNGNYLYVNRLNFASLNRESDGSVQGIYFDDVIYRAFSSSNPNVIHDEYSTSFEPRES